MINVSDLLLLLSLTEKSQLNATPDNQQTT